MGAWLRIAGVLLFLVLALYAGMWLGGATAPRIEDLSASASVPAPPASTPNTGTLDRQTSRHPVYLHVGLTDRPRWEIVEQEIALAQQAGVKHYVFSLPLFPMSGTPMEVIEHLLKRPELSGVDTEILLDINLNPPTSWLEEHAASALTTSEGTLAVSPASDEWIELVRQELIRLVARFSALQLPAQIDGVVLSALDEGNWRTHESGDNSEVNNAAFIAWLKQAYHDDESMLKRAWGNLKSTFESSLVPISESVEEDTPAFYKRAAEQPNVDYARYRSELVPQRILQLADYVRNTGYALKAFASYGYTLEHSNAADGHLGLGRLLDSSLDGFMTPVSYFERGLGGVGGPTGPIDSALLRGKKWIVIDDTHTDLNARHSAAPGVESTVPLEDVLNVFRRNFSFAVLHDVAIAWSDRMGTGNLNDEALWDSLGRLVELEFIDTPPQLAPTSSLAVVVDEESLLYQRRSDVTATLIADARDTAMRAGLSTKFVLLEEVLDDQFAGASVYLFLNAFRLDESQRTKLHERFARERSAAIWLYAPGYLSDTEGSVEAISAATMMTAVELEENLPAPRSTFTITGNWLTEGAQFGALKRFQPVFAIADEEADVIANYAGTKSASVAVKFVGDAWTSIYIAEPSLTVPLLRECFDILELSILPSHDGQLADDLIQYDKNLVMIHARKPGHRVFDLGTPLGVIDLLNPEIGWPRKRQITFRMDTGDTHLFRLTSTESAGNE